MATNNTAEQRDDFMIKILFKNSTMNMKQLQVFDIEKIRTELKKIG